MNITIPGIPVKDIISKGNLDEMRELAVVTSYLSRIRTSDLESDESNELKEAHNSLLVAISEREKIQLSRENILTIHDGIVVIDNIQLARSLKSFVESDLEGPYIKVTIGWE